MLLLAIAFGAPSLAQLEAASQQAMARGGEPDHRGRCGASHSLWMREPMVLDEELARVLLDYEGSCLVLDGVHSAFPAALQILADGRRRGGLLLDCLTSLDVDQGKALSNYHGELTLDGLHQIDAEAAQALGDGPLEGPKRLFMDGLQTLDSLVGLQSLSPGTARNLLGDENHGWSALRLPLHRFGNRALIALTHWSSREREELVLTGTTTLSPSTARILGSWEDGADLDLTALTTLDLETAMNLAPFGRRGIVLPGLVRAEEDVCLALTGFLGNRLEIGFHSLSPNDAEVLASWSGYTLILSNLEAPASTIAVLEARRGIAMCPACEEKPWSR